MGALVKYTLPLPEDYKEFCEHMGYKLVKVVKDYYYFEIPAKHICKLNINLLSYNKGTFKKENFLKN